jgi:hypothetical protein
LKARTGEPPEIPQEVVLVPVPRRGSGEDDRFQADRRSETIISCCLRELTRKGLRGQVSKSNGRSTGKQISGKNGNKSVTATAKTKSALSVVHPFDKSAGQIDGDF